MEGVQVIQLPLQFGRHGEGDAVEEEQALRGHTVYFVYSTQLNIYSGKAILNSGFALHHVLHPAMLIPMLCHFQNCLSFHSSPTISRVGIFEQDRKFLECRLQCKPQQRKFKWL